MEGIVRVGEQSYNIVPIEIKHFGPVYDRFQDLEGWRVTVNFKGNILGLAYQQDLCRKYGIFPRGAEMIYRDYSSARDITQIRYMFNSGLFKKRCEKRATQFKQEIQNKMNSGQQHAGR